MPDVQPTTVQNLERGGRSPCCDAPLDRASPPNRYECRECLEQYDLSEDDEGSDDESGTCDVVKSDGEVCGRELPCRYHS